MRVLMFAASARLVSVNKKLIQQAAKLIAPEHVIDHADFSEFDVPLYHGDLNAKIGLPAGAQQFIARMDAVDGIIISSPEYNFSIPGTLKNLIDWVSRGDPNPWRGRQLLLMSASPSLVGGNRGLWHTRVPLEACGAFVYPDMFSLANAYAAFSPEGQLQDAQLRERLQANVTAFLHYLARITQQA